MFDMGRDGSQSPLVVIVFGTQCILLVVSDLCQLPFKLGAKAFKQMTFVPSIVGAGMNFFQSFKQ